MFSWGKIPASCTDVEELTEKALQEARVFIAPGFIFGSNEVRYIHTSPCCKDAKLAEALERVKSIMKQQLNELDRYGTRINLIAGRGR